MIRKLQIDIPHEQRHKIPHKTLVNRIQQYTKRIITYD